MSSGIDKLKKIGIQKIHEDTHISRAHIEIIFQENFEELHSSVQLNGFLSILEREYSVDLNDLRVKSKGYFEDLAKNPHVQMSKTNLFFVENKKKKSTFIYILLGATIFILFAYFNTDILEEEFSKKEQSDKTEIEIKSDDTATSIEKTLLAAEENSIPLDQNQSAAEEIQEHAETLIKIKKIDQEALKEEPKGEPIQEKKPLKQEAKESLLKIIPKSKVWVGYIERATGKKYQTVSANELSLDSAKDWLLTFGHGHLDIEIDGKLHKYQSANNLRFIYEDGKLKELSLDEFKELNSGKLW